MVDNTASHNNMNTYTVRPQAVMVDNIANANNTNQSSVNSPTVTYFYFIHVHKCSLSITREKNT